MHQHVAHPPGPEPSPSLIDNISDTLLNAFSRVRKPDERFLAMREGVDKFEDDLGIVERLGSRIRGRMNGKPCLLEPELGIVEPVCRAC
jgi:sorting nexin-4